MNSISFDNLFLHDFQIYNYTTIIELIVLSCQNIPLKEIFCENYHIYQKFFISITKSKNCVEWNNVCYQACYAFLSQTQKNYLKVLIECTNQIGSGHRVISCVLYAHKTDNRYRRLLLFVVTC